MGGGLGAGRPDLVGSGRFGANPTITRPASAATYPCILDFTLRQTTPVSRLTSICFTIRNLQRS
jgi:hypothetical protein